MSESWLLSHMLILVFSSVQISFARQRSLSAGITAVSPAPGCVTEPTTAVMAQMRAADAVSHNSYRGGAGVGGLRKCQLGGVGLNRVEREI